MENIYVAILLETTFGENGHHPDVMLVMKPGAVAKAIDNAHGAVIDPSTVRPREIPQYSILMLDTHMTSLWAGFAGRRKESMSAEMQSATYYQVFEKGVDSALRGAEKQLEKRTVPNAQYRVQALKSFLSLMGRV